MALYRIEVQREVCVGDGLCREIAPGTFDLDGEGCCVVLDPAGDPPRDILQAARECRCQAIILYDAATGQRVFPPS